MKQHWYFDVAPKVIRLLERRLGKAEQRSGDEFDFPCPRCGDDGNHLGVNVRRAKFHCFRCGYGERGRADLHVLILDLYKSRPADVEKLKSAAQEARLAYKKLADSSSWKRHDKEARIKPVLKGFIPLWNASENSVTAKQLIKYLHGRGVTDDQIERHDIGYCEDLRYLGYVVLPVYDDDCLVYFTTRAAYPWTKPKNLNPSRFEAWREKTEVVYNLDMVRRNDHIVVCEGPFDAIACTWFDPGVTCTGVALLGSGISPIQASLIAAAKPRRVTVFLDPDRKREEVQPVFDALQKTGIEKLVVVGYEEPTEQDPADMDDDTRAGYIESANFILPTDAIRMLTRKRRRVL